MNITIAQGRPTKDPELKQSEKGNVFCKFWLVAERPYRGKNAPKEKDFLPIICFGKLAQTVYNNLGKGALCTVLGTLENDDYIDKFGNEVRTFVIKANKITIHEWLRKHRPLEELEADFDEQLIPREITDSLYKQIDVDDEDIPDDLVGRLPDDFAGGIYD